MTALVLQTALVPLLLMGRPGPTPVYLGAAAATPTPERAVSHDSQRLSLVGRAAFTQPLAEPLAIKPAGSLGTVVVYAGRLVVRTRPDYYSDPTGYELEQGDHVVQCPHPKKDQSYSRKELPGGKSVQWYYVAHEGDSCDAAIGWIPKQHPVTGLCSNFAAGNAPTCWDFWNWETGKAHPEQTEQIHCPARINHLRSRLAEREYGGRPIGSPSPVAECLRLATISAAFGYAGKRGAMYVNLPRWGVQGAGLVSAAAAGWTLGAPPRMKKHAPKIVEATLAATTTTTTWIPAPGWGGVAATVAGTAVCLYMTYSALKAAYPTCHHRSKRFPRVALAYGTYGHTWPPPKVTLSLLLGNAVLRH